MATEMRNSKRSLLLGILAGLWFTACPATAQDSVSDIPRELDDSGDGKLQRDEAPKSPPPRREPAVAPQATPPPRTLVEVIERLDTNGDHRLSSDEVPPSIRKGFRRLDLDADGFFDLGEARTLDAQRNARQSAPRPRTLVRVVGLMDTDGDGLLQKKEAPLAVQRLFEQLDRNGDGAIDLDEARAADAARVKPEEAR